jgi:hypothetical protein
MTEERPFARLGEQGLTAGGSGDSTLDLTALVAVHRGLRRDLRHFVHGVGGTPVDERDTWQALCERWAVFSALAHHHHQWERLTLWPLVTAGARRARDERAAMVVAHLAAATAVCEKLIESCRPVFERLAAARDEDAAATLRARVRAASMTLEDTLDDEDAEGLPLVLRHVSSAQWRDAVRLQFVGASPYAFGWASLPWLVHQLPVQLAAVMAAEWAAPSSTGLRDGTAAFRRLETIAFRHSVDLAT